MFDVRKLCRLRVARLAGLALLSAACVTHLNKPVADSAAHALGSAGHAAPPGLERVVFAPPAPV
jgi:hypothetical protein